MTPDKRADREERLAKIEETTEQRMHAVADLLPDTDQVDERADKLSRSARAHQQRAEQLRADEARQEEQPPEPSTP